MKKKVDSLEIEGVKYVPESSIEHKKLGDEVIIRTYSAGVHIGNLDEKWTSRDQIVTLKNSRRLYNWNGANTLNEIANSGLDRKNSKISKPVSEIMLNPIEVIPVAASVDLSETWS